MAGQGQYHFPGYQAPHYVAYQPPQPTEWTGGQLLEQETYTSPTHKTYTLSLEDSPILFRVGPERRGIRVSDALAGNFALLEGANEQLDLPDDVEGKVTLRMHFVGYGSTYHKSLYIRHGSARVPHSRADIAAKVAAIVRDFVDKVDQGILRPVDPASARLFGSGPGRIPVEHMYIMKLEQRSKGSFQPEIRYCPW